MKKIKINIDREGLGSDYIKSRQDFGQVLNEVNKLKPPIWSSAWFYGPIGFSVFIVAVSITALEPPLDMKVKNAVGKMDCMLLIKPVNSENRIYRAKTIFFDKNTTLKGES